MNENRCSWCGHAGEHQEALRVRGEADVQWCLRCPDCQNEAFLTAGDRASELLQSQPDAAVARLDEAGFVRDDTGDWRRQDWHIDHALPTVLALRWVMYVELWGMREPSSPSVSR